MSGTCYRCGQKLGLFASSTAIICEPCEKRRGNALAIWGQALREALHDGIIFFHEELRLRQMQAQLGLLDHELSAFLPTLQYAKMVVHARAGMIAPMAPPFPTQRGEVVYFASEAFISDSRLETTWIKGFQGRRGFNADLPIPIPLGPGRFAMTNQRFLVHGPMWIETSASNIFYTQLASDGLYVHLRDREAPVLLNCHQNDYAKAVISYAGEANGEVRPMQGYAFAYDATSPTDDISIFPDENALAYFESVLLAERKDEARAFSGRMPKMPGGTLVLLGAPASTHIGFRIENGPHIGKSGYVAYASIHSNAPP